MERYAQKEEVVTSNIQNCNSISKVDRRCLIFILNSDSYEYNNDSQCI